MFMMKGVIPPVITPFFENGEVDYDGVKKLTAYLKNEVDGMFITGSYGSGALLSMEERKKITEVTIKEAGLKIPIVVHVGTADSKSAAELARHAMESGAAAVSAVGPYYYKHNPDSICAFYDQILKATGGDFPVYVYNNPGFQGYLMDLKLLQRLKKLGVHGIKDATFDIMAHANYMRTLKDDNFDIALGTEAMWLSACVLGCEAFIPGLGNALPEICRQMYKEGMNREYDKLRETQFKVNEIRDIMYLAKSTQMAIYAMLEIRGILKAYPRSPFLPATDDEKAAIKTRLKQLDVL
ncbi:MAG: dihydrodipicolinate synthase family protein [Oscillospiraceae bacterium]